MAFYEFHQNNSGGRFTEPAIYVIVEADFAEQANSIAESNGVYFNGCDEGMDCDCCGDRWNSVWGDEKGTEIPSVYGQPLEKKEAMRDEWAKRDQVPYAMVVYKDGRKEVL